LTDIVAYNGKISLLDLFVAYLRQSFNGLDVIQAARNAINGIGWDNNQPTVGQTVNYLPDLTGIGIFFVKPNYHNTKIIR
jgi:hypothetical protein